VVGSFNRKLYRKVMHICSCRPICAYDLVLIIFVPNFYSVCVSSRLFSPITFSAVFQSMAYMISVLKFMNTISQWFPKYAPWIPRGLRPVPRGFLDAYTLN